MTTQTKKRATRLFALAGLGLLVALPALWGTVEASPPGRPARRMGTALLFPPPVRSLRFSHAKHPPSDFECTTCHKRATTSTRATDKLRPSKKVCVDCHDEAQPPKNLGQPGVKVNTKACRKCHTRIDARGVPTVAKWPKPRIRFPHKLHVDRKVACKTCHAGVAKSGFGSPRHLPKMATCFKCHDGKPKSPPSRCVTCHVRTAGGRIRTHFPGGSLKPGASLPHLEHGVTWRRNHKVAARAHQGDCATCHEKSTCLRCHAGIRKPASIHLGNYILLHGREARANRRKCNACHTRQRFCLSCHQRTGVAKSNTRSPYQVTPGVRKFHGERWASSSTRGAAFNRHATHARRNVSTCVSCHRERDCMRCHARRRVGGFGHSPHGPGFRRSRRCKVLLRKNLRACLKCHGFNDPLMSMCR